MGALWSYDFGLCSVGEGKFKYSLGLGLYVVAAEP